MIAILIQKIGELSTTMKKRHILKANKNEAELKYQELEEFGS